MLEKTVRRPRRGRITKRDILAWILLLPSLFCFIIVLWQPLISGVFLSFFETQGYDAVRFVGMENYIDVIKNSEFMAALTNTFSCLNFRKDIVQTITRSTPPTC